MSQPRLLNTTGVKNDSVWKILGKQDTKILTCKVNSSFNIWKEMSHKVTDKTYTVFIRA